MADITRTLPSPSDILIALRNEYKLTANDSMRADLTITTDGTSVRVRWTGGLVHDLLSINGDLNYLSSSMYWSHRAKFTETLGYPLVEDWDNNEWRITLQ
jgi:hypothetical protein